jgi:hypothetical protein
MKQGYNAPWFFNNFRSSNYYVPALISEQIRLLKPEVLRFMGGTLGNYYDSKKPGYGFETTQAIENYLSRLSYLMSQLPDTKISFVANVYQPLMTGNMNYWLDNMMGVLTKLPQIAYVELGNEINIDGKYMECGDKPRLFQSLTKFNAHVAGRAQRYLDICDMFVNAVKEYDSQIKVGLPMGNYENNNPRSKEWNRVLRTYTKHDAEIFHIYLTTKQYMETKYEVDRILVGAKKPVWVTEWSWSHGMDGDKNLGDVGTLPYKYFFKDFPDICKIKGVELITRHQLYGDNIYSLIK